MDALKGTSLEEKAYQFWGARSFLRIDGWSEMEWKTHQCWRAI